MPQFLSIYSFFGDLLTLKTHHYKPNSMNLLNSMKELWKNSIALAVDYCERDEPTWCALTWGFIVEPLVVGFLFVFMLVVTRKEGVAVFLFKIFKISQVFESGPQLLLQAYILALSEMDITSTSGNTSFSSCPSTIANRVFHDRPV